MARMRTLKPGFFTSEGIAPRLSFRARLTFAGLWTYCDDHGRGKDNTRLIAADVWPLDDDVTPAEVDEDLDALVATGHVVRYSVSGARYLAVQNWHFHQSPNRPGDTTIPAPPVPITVPAPGKRGHCETCWTTHEQFTEPTLIPHEQLTAGMGGKGREKEGGGGARERATAPPPGSRPRCTRHAHLPDDDPGPNCIACKDVRLAAERVSRSPTPKPEWCGECDENTRQVEREDGGVGRCRDCHPLRSVS